MAQCSLVAARKAEGLKETFKTFGLTSFTTNFGIWEVGSGNLIWVDAP